MSKPQSPYAGNTGDVVRVFPYNTLKRFEPLAYGERLLAVIYEPSARGTGRQAFIGWASISGSPVRSSRRTSSSGAALVEIRY